MRLKSVLMSFMIYRISWQLLNISMILSLLIILTSLYIFLKEMIVFQESIGMGDLKRGLNGLVKDRGIK